MVAGLSHATIYVYEGPNNERIFTDRKITRPGYRLLTRGKQAEMLGTVAAGRSQSADFYAPDIYRPMVIKAANRYDVPSQLAVAIAQVESNFNPVARSSAGALGIMQLMPDTATRLGLRDPFDAEANIDAGVRHLMYLLKRFDNDLPRVIAAYNAGENAVVRADGVPPYPETQAYVGKVMQLLEAGH